MARKLKHASSRKSKHTKGKKYSVRKHSNRKHSNRRITRRNRRREGGADILGGAPVGYHLSGSWPSQMSLGQGADYFKYHEGQHGGSVFTGAPLSAIDARLPEALRGPAHVGGIDKAIADVQGLSDGPTAPVAVVQGAVQAVKTGGRHKRGHHGKSKKHGHKNKKGSRARRNKKRGGAVLGYAPFPSSGMLLSSPTQYAQAGLNPQWKTDVAFDLSKVRDSQ